ncbi:MAG: hypothetical protein LBQ08_00830 [Holosporaceae bacterium]|jgi:hypothetical protein|nr:hypothetical protein [Holosporaceae bacterium]
MGVIFPSDSLLKVIERGNIPGIGITPVPINPLDGAPTMKYLLVPYGTIFGDEIADSPCVIEYYNGPITQKQAELIAMRNGSV